MCIRDSYNDVDTVANSLMGSYFAGINMFDALEEYKNVTVESINERLQKTMCEEKSALSVVKEK